MDISFNTESGIFNFRVAAIIENEGKFLVTDHKDKNYLSLIGGRAKIGESSIDTIKREVLEETGYKVSEAKVMGVIENFFEFKDNNYHEILILIKVDFEDKSIYAKEKIACQDKKGIYFTWKNIDKLKKENLKPSILIDYLNEPNLFHLINKD